jgi:hypothetical protein
MSKSTAKAITRDELINHSYEIDGSIDNTIDPLPWLIHSLREKQADQSQATSPNPTTEPKKDSQ